jgi:quercetin dioxygenase-like cupin family protein
MKVMSIAKVTPWQGAVPPTRNELVRKLTQEGLSGYEWSNEPGDVYAVHSHAYNKVIYVAEGHITFPLPDTLEELQLEPGDRLDLPSGVRHGARVGTQGVRCLEAHWT